MPRPSSLLARAAVAVVAGAGALLPAAAQGRVVVVRMVDGGQYAMRFDPARPTAAPGDTLRFVQAGRLPHNVEFRSVPPGVELGAAARSPFLERPGATHDIVLDARFRPGRYVFVCAPHEVMGMAGILTVAADTSAGGAPAPADGGAWSAQSSGTTASLRGIHAVSARVAWASGSGGTVLRTTDGGATWRADTVPGAAALDFRDVHALDADTAWLMSAGDGAASTIWKTTDGGRRWRTVWTNPDSASFFDAIAFWDARRGIAVGDPVDGRFRVVVTADGGETWTRVPDEALPPALAGEAAFAASGTALVTAGDRHAWLATGGGGHGRVFRTADGGRTWSVATTPVPAPGSSSGIFSIAFADARRGVAVGGDFTRPGDPGDVVARTDDGGATWTLAGRAAPPGYKSAVVVVPGTDGRALIAAGLSGSGISRDGGATWTALDALRWHALSFAAPDAGWIVGPDGRIARWRGAAAR